MLFCMLKNPEAAAVVWCAFICCMQTQRQRVREEETKRAHGMQLYGFVSGPRFSNGSQ